MGQTSWVFVTVLVLVSVGATPTPAESGFYAGATLRSNGQLRPAVKELLRVARDHPADHFADDALFEAASILHRELYAPVEALAVYRELVEGFPQSRHLPRVEKARGELERYASDGSGAWAAVEDFLRLFYGPQQAPDLQAAGWRDFLQAHPDFAGRGQILVLLGHCYRQAGQTEKAAAAYSEALEMPAEEPWLAGARRGLGELALARDDIEGAEVHYAAISGQSALSQGALESGLKRRRFVRQMRRVASVAVLLIAGLLLMWARPWGRWTGLWPPPLEVRFLTVVLGVGVALALAYPGADWTLAPMATVGGAALIYMWLVPLILEGPSLRAKLHWLLPLLGFVLLSGLCFLTLSGRGLDAELVETIKRGPQR